MIAPWNPANLHELPDYVDALKAMILATQAKVASAEHKRRRLEAEIAQMKADKAADVDRIDRLESTSHAAAGSIWNAIGKAADRSSR